jgi:hypothetical protein
MKSKYIILISFILVLIGLAYFLFQGKYNINDNNGSSDSKVCRYGKDNNGNCIIPELCYDNSKPSLSCKDNQSLICDPIIKNWRCKLKCESQSNPFPYDFSNCDNSNIKCDSFNKFYCDSNYCKNGGILYSDSNGRCNCQKLFSGDKCECDSSKCKGGEIDKDCNKCLSCCDSETSKNNKCQYYGDNCQNECPPNYVYDKDQQKCICPACFKEISDPDNPSKQKCIQLSNDVCCANGTILNNKCICKDGWKGPNCDIPPCNSLGKWDENTQKCICNIDENGNPLAAGDNCEYSRDKFCNGNGIPRVVDGVPSCECKGFSGPHCTCDNSNKPTNIFSCKGIYSQCQEIKNTDGSYSGNWIQGYEKCNDIYNDYGGREIWEQKCTSDILGIQYKYPYYKVTCMGLENPDETGAINKFYGRSTCNNPPLDTDLDNCKRDGCYDIDTSKPFDKACLCSEDSNGYAVYNCQSVQTDTNCGMPPPSGFCKDGNGNIQTPVCYSYDSVNYMWGCPNQVLPKDVIINRDNLISHKKDPLGTYKDDNIWYGTKRNDPIYPIVNIDKCDINPFDTLVDNGVFSPGWRSIDQSQAFVSNIGTPQEKYYDRNDSNLLVYNIKNAKITDNGNKIIYDDNDPYPYSKSFKDLMNNTKDGIFTGCAKIKSDYDPNNENNNKCAFVHPEYSYESDDSYVYDSYGNKKLKEAGYFQKICADSNNNILFDKDKKYTCDNAYYMTDIGKCNCTFRYKSFAQPDNDYVTYKGNYCQYNDNDNCSKQGIVDDNGKCDCIPYYSYSQKQNVKYIGDKCQYSDNTDCDGFGIVKVIDNYKQCDFTTPLKNISNYTIVYNPLEIQDGDIIIIEYVTSGLPLDSNGIPTITPQNLFISSTSNPLTVDIIPNVFKVVVKGDNSFTFGYLDTDNIKEPSLLEPYLYYLYTTNDQTTSISYGNGGSTYTFDLKWGNVGKGDSYIMSSLSSNGLNSMICDYNSKKLTKGNDIWHQTLWRIHKFKKI